MPYEVLFKSGHPLIFPRGNTEYGFPRIERRLTVIYLTKIESYPCQEQPGDMNL
jgi:hypothetical protein